MDPNSIENRKTLGYEALNDTRYGIKPTFINLPQNNSSFIGVIYVSTNLCLRTFVDIPRYYVF